ncbi:MAG: uroporphyrinogen-III synthase [Actinomycetota bacterium]|nr:uroporphyrinogen-III synthase [Actinomycetota bacterium]
MSRAADESQFLRSGGRPLAGITILVPRAVEQAGDLSERIRRVGGEVVEAPTIEIRPGKREELAAALRSLEGGGYTAVCFTSPNGVRAVADALAVAGLPPRVFDGLVIAAVGPGTAATLAEVLGVRPDLVPETATTEALAGAFPPGSGRVLLPRADIASPALPEGLRARGYEPVPVTAYVTTPPERLPGEVMARLAAGGIDLLAFTSSSTARNFALLVAGQPWSGRVVSIGPVTSATCAELGIEVAAEADPHDLDGLVAAFVAAAGQHEPGATVLPVHSSSRRERRRG